MPSVESPSETCRQESPRGRAIHVPATTGNGDQDVNELQPSWRDDASSTALELLPTWRIGEFGHAECTNYGATTTTNGMRCETRHCKAMTVVPGVLAPTMLWKIEITVVSCSGGRPLSRLRGAHVRRMRASAQSGGMTRTHKMLFLEPRAPFTVDYAAPFDVTRRVAGESKTPPRIVVYREEEKSSATGDGDHGQAEGMSDVKPAIAEAKCSTSGNNSELSAMRDTSVPPPKSLECLFKCVLCAHTTKRAHLARYSVVHGMRRPDAISEEEKPKPSTMPTESMEDRYTNERIYCPSFTRFPTFQ